MLQIMECAVHIWDVKNFPLDSTGRSLRKHRENKDEEWRNFINQLSTQKIDL